jgi:hypothetical protein
VWVSHGQGHVGEGVAVEDLKELQVGVADVLDVVAVAALHVADVAGVEVHRDCLGAGVEDGHAPPPLDPVLPLVRVGVPVHLAQPAGAQRDQRGGDRLGGEKVPAVGDPHLAALRLPHRRAGLEGEGEGMGRRAGLADRGHLVGR